MTYVFLVAGKGTRMEPLTYICPKSLYNLEKDVTVIRKMVRSIRKYDNHAKIIAVTGYMHESIEKNLETEDVVVLYNPFYEFTNSIASLWFAKDMIDDEGVVIINGDIVASDHLVENIICTIPDRASVLIDSSIKNDGDYNAEVSGDRIVVMSKGLDHYYGEYAGVTKLDRASYMVLKHEMEAMINQGKYTLWYEDVLVQMIFEKDFALYFEDVNGYDWTEIDTVNDLLLARRIHQNRIC